MLKLINHPTQSWLQAKKGFIELNAQSTLARQYQVNIPSETARHSQECLLCVTQKASWKSELETISYVGMRNLHWDQIQKTHKTSKSFYKLKFSSTEINYAGKIIFDNNVNSMEAGFLNYGITPYIGLLIKKTTVIRKPEIRNPKFVWNSNAQTVI